MQWGNTIVFTYKIPGFDSVNSYFYKHELYTVSFYTRDQQVFSEYKKFSDNHFKYINTQEIQDDTVLVKKIYKYTFHNNHIGMVENVNKELGCGIDFVNIAHYPK